MRPPDLSASVAPRLCMSAILEELPDRHRWSFDEHRVTRLSVELGAVRLETWTLQASAELRLGVPFTLRQADGIERTIDPDEPEQLAPMLTLVGRALEALTVTRPGDLVAGFSDGTVLHVEPHARYEAWQLQGGGGLEGMSYVCGPGGGPVW